MTAIEPQVLDSQPVEMKIRVNPTLMQAAAALLLAGAISVAEARDIAGLPPMSEKDQAFRRMMAIWCQNTGRTDLAPWLPSFWPGQGKKKKPMVNDAQ